MMLEKKGYKVAIENRYSARILFQKTDVIIAPYLYKNETVAFFALQPFYHLKKIINMQYEQLFFKKGKMNLTIYLKNEQKTLYIFRGERTLPSDTKKTESNKITFLK